MGDYIFKNFYLCINIFPPKYINKYYSPHQSYVLGLPFNLLCLSSRMDILHSSQVDPMGRSSNEAVIESLWYHGKLEKLFQSPALL